jgi:ketosteroid isomerase-like protein
MSKQNVELFHKGMEAFLRGDIEPLVETSHPEIEWYPFSSQVEGDAPYHGHDGVREWWVNVNATFKEFEASIDQVRDVGDVVVALGRLRARFRSGITLDSEMGWVFRFRDGLAVWGRAYQSHAEALKAAGLADQNI